MAGMKKPSGKKSSPKPKPSGKKASPKPKPSGKKASPKPKPSGKKASPKPKPSGKKSTIVKEVPRPKVLKKNDKKTMAYMAWLRSKRKSEPKKKTTSRVKKTSPRRVTRHK